MMPQWAILEIDKPQKYVPIENSFYLKICLKKGIIHGILFPGIPALNSRETGMSKIRLLFLVYIREIYARS